MSCDLSQWQKSVFNTTFIINIKMCSSHHSLGTCLITAFSGIRVLGSPQDASDLCSTSCAPCANSDFSSQYGVKSEGRISHSLETPLFPTHWPFFVHHGGWRFWAGPLANILFCPSAYLFFLNPFLFKETPSSTEVEIMHHFAYVYHKQETGEVFRSWSWCNHVVLPWEEQIHCSQGQVTST